MNSKQVVVDGLLVNYWQGGNGPLILMFHGWGDTADTFKLIADKLLPDYGLIALDLPGFGKTDPPPTSWDLDDYARFVQTFLTKLNLSDVYAVIGHSNGGALAIRGLSTGELKSQKLVLLAAAGIRDQEKAKKLGLKIVAKTGKAATFFLPKQTRQSLRKKLYGVAGSDMFVAPHIQETFKQTVRQDVQTDAIKLNLPTLLIYGTEDTATPPHYGQIYNSLIKDSQLELITGSGHFVHQEQPEMVSQLIEGFLK